MNGILLIIILLLIYINILLIYAVYSLHEVIEIQRKEYINLEYEYMKLKDFFEEKFERRKRK